MGSKGGKFSTKRKSIMAGASEKEIYDQEFLLSFKHLDRIQGQRLSDWDDIGILSQAIETLWGYCGESLVSQSNNKKFTIYGDFPPKDKTDFTHPKHVPEDARWARIHITGKICVIGHVVRNIFNVVFLDMEHRFWISEKKNT
jgi:hypothetical protein